MLELVIEAAQQLINNWLKGVRHGIDFHSIQELLKREYVSSKSNIDARKKILDIIDQMYLEEIYGVENIVLAHDRN